MVVTVVVALGSTSMPGLAVFSVVQSSMDPWQPGPTEIPTPLVSWIAIRRSTGALWWTTDTPASPVWEMSQPSIVGLPNW